MSILQYLLSEVTPIQKCHTIVNGHGTLDIWNSRWFVEICFIKKKKTMNNSGSQMFKMAVFSLDTHSHTSDRGACKLTQNVGCHKTLWNFNEKSLEENSGRSDWHQYLERVLQRRIHLQWTWQNSNVQRRRILPAAPACRLQSAMGRIRRVGGSVHGPHNNGHAA